MLANTFVAPATVQFSTAVEVILTADPARGQRCRLHHQSGYVDAWTWLELGDVGHPRVLTGRATTMEITCGGTDYLLLGFAENSDEPLRSILTDALCPIAGVVRQTSGLVDRLRIAPLRRFVKRALLQPEALTRYWECPASRRDHHAYPGGLAEHSLEVATMVASVSGLPDEDRELGIAFALLHDFGKIWCYEQGRRIAVSSKDHEAYGRSRLENPLEALTNEDPHLAARMDELLGGPRAPRNTAYPLAIGRIIRSFDQMSCEKTRKSREAECVLEDSWMPF